MGICDFDLVMLRGCMVVKFDLHTPPFMKGIAFVLTGFTI
jgi:hypothetical protein